MILIFNFEIHPTARIGYSILLCKKLELHSNTKIRHLNFCKKIDKIVLKEYSTIGSLNFITGFSTGNNDFALKNNHFIDNSDRKCELIVDIHSAITSRHFFDCNGGIYIGKFTIIAGLKSVFLTHSVDIYSSSQQAKPIIISDYCFVGTGSHILGGSCLPDYAVLSAGALLNKNYDKSYQIYGGVPAKPIKNLNGIDVAYFKRKEGFIH